uniref:Uncharacterized protein n=1 Tax=Mycena chlorophos TaxID=658473 RepID=A0ABQ0M6F9_MYCCL|nr:predicted protein [Mycena chlorophos]
MRRLCTLLACLLVGAHAASLTNLTIDDANLTYFSWFEDPRIVPAPTFPWAAISPGNPCLYCSAQPPTADIHDQTWHDGSNNSEGTFTFQGAAVAIYGIDLDNPANITFMLDGQPAGYHYYDGTAQFAFNSLFYSAAGLALGVNHTVAWELHTTKTNGSTGLFDYAVISVEEASPSASAAPASSSKSKSSNTGAIAGGVVGGVVALGAVVAVAVFLSKRRRKTIVGEKPATGDAVVEPFPSEAATSGRSPSPSTQSPGESKTLDVAWSDPSLSLSTQPTLPASALTDAASISPTVGTGTTQRERELEARLAALESQMHYVVAEPPPYVPPPPSE